jgi:hypothetical protein
LGVLAAAYTAVKLAAAFSAVINTLNAAVAVMTSTTVSAALAAGGLTAALGTLALAASGAIVLSVAVGGIIYAIDKVNELNRAWDQAAASAALSNDLDNTAIKAIRNNPNLSKRGEKPPDSRATRSWLSLPLVGRCLPALPI